MKIKNRREKRREIIRTIGNRQKIRAIKRPKSRIPNERRQPQKSEQWLYPPTITPLRVAKAIPSYGCLSVCHGIFPFQPRRNEPRKFLLAGHHRIKTGIHS
jgi:hypothetical protein